ncbi:uncharacterized protein LOC135954448 [Calliphora vicina]|uniref:uncharacterized protein LOC135954448 n=1 Tax=Calliphora vicina TaxID=7373 RepID=UPI00325B6A63
MEEENENNREMTDIHNSDSEEMVDIHNTSNHNNSDSEGDVDPLNQYTNAYLDYNRKGENDSNNDESLEDKGYRTFLVADYVDYCKTTNMSKCLIRNCERPMSGRRTGNIKRHYHKVHKLVIVHSNKPAEKINEATAPQSCITVNLSQYFDYDPLLDKSRCRVPGCNTALVGRKPNNIMRHYSMVHNFKIEPDKSNESNEPVYSPPESKEQSTDASSISVDDLVILDEETSTYQCLFVTCNQVLEKDLASIEKHYNEVHKVVIARDSDNIPNRFYRKRIYRYIHQPFENDQEYVENKLQEYMNQTVATTSSIKNELLSDDEQALIEPISNLQVPLGKRGFGKFDLSSYVDYEEDKKVSKCLIRHCKRSMSGSLVGNIKRHYLTIHNFVILHGSHIPFEDIEEMSHVTGDQINSLVCYDKNSLHQCLFINCNHILEENLSTIKRHYLEIHKIIIVRYSDYIMQRKRRYRDMLQSYENECPDDEASSVFNEFLSDDDKGQNEPQTEQLASMEKIKYGKLQVENYVDYQKDTNISKCLIKQCKRTMSGCFVGNVKRHYLTIHKFHILHGTRMPYKDMDDMSNITGQEIDDLVPYDIATSSYQCLFINCNQILVKHLPVIQKHYHDVHKIVIARDTDKISARKSMYGDIYQQSNESEFPDEEFYSGFNEFFSDDEQPQCSKNQNEPHNMQQLLNLGKKGWGKFIFANYVQYEKDTNNSKCLIKHCKRSMSGCIVGNIKRHYKRIHNFIILHGLRMPFEEIGDISDNVTVDDLVAYDIETSSYQCLFINCNQVLDKHLPTVKRHYCKTHKVILARDSDKGQRKRRHREIYEPYENELLEDESCSVRNECLSDDEQPHCSKRSNMNLTDYMDDTEVCFIKQENISEDEERTHNNFTIYTSDTESQFIKKQYISKHDQPYAIKHSLKLNSQKAQNLPVNKPNLQKTSPGIYLTLSKQQFFQLCLGLLIERDLPLNLFDDEKYFKPLLAPYAQKFNCIINAGVMQKIMLKANNIIVEDLRNTFTNKIVCLELHVVKQENNYYMIINVRFLEEQTICNKLIGFLPIKETTKILPLAECLSRFNIDEQHVYMKTIMAGLLQEDEEIYKICNEICKHNPDVKHHPIYDLQRILRSLVEKYSEDIKTWQVLSEYQEKSTKDMLTNLKEFAQYLENWSKTDLNLQKAKDFFKAMQIFGNFMEKLDGEQYVAGDFYRDWLCCELGLKGEQTKHNNLYAAELYEDLVKCKNKLLAANEFIAALYLDARFNFLGSRLLSDEQKSQGKLFLCDIWDRFNSFLMNATSNDDALPNDAQDNDNSNDDEYALLTQHINDTMPVKSKVSMHHKLTNFVPSQRQPISMDILKYWHCNRQFMEDINELTKIVFTHSASQYILRDLQTNFTVPNKDSDKLDKFLIKCNQCILEKNTARIFEGFN